MTFTAICTHRRTKEVRKYLCKNVVYIGFDVQLNCKPLGKYYLPFQWVQFDNSIWQVEVIY